MQNRDCAIIELRPADFGRCAAIWDIKRQAHLAAKFLAELESGNRQTFIYMENEAFIGEVSLVYDVDDQQYAIPGQRLYLSHMIVQKARRGEGIGTQLLLFLLEYAAMLGYREIALGVDADNTAARDFYAKHGFTEVLFEGRDAQGPYLKLLRRG